MDTSDTAGIAVFVGMISVMAGIAMGYAAGRWRRPPFLGSRMDRQRMQLQVLVDRPNGERVWADVAGEQGAEWENHGRG